MQSVVPLVSNFNDYIAKNLEYKTNSGRCHDPSLCRNKRLVANYIRTTSLRNDGVDASCFKASKLSSFQGRDVQPKFLFNSIKRFLREFDSLGDGVIRDRLGLLLEQCTIC